MEFTGFVDNAVKLATEILKNEKEVPQTLLVADGEHHISMITLLIDKTLFKRAIREVLSKVNAKFYVVVYEAWYLSWKMGETPPPKLPISEQPERKEAVVVVGYSRDGQRLTIWIPFERGPNGDIGLKTPKKTADFEDNLIGNLFPPRLHKQTSG